MRASDETPLTSDVEVGRRARERRTALRLPQVELAERLAALGHPVHQTAVGKIEAGERPLRLVEASALARVLGVSTAWLLGEDEQAPAPVVDPALARALLTVREVATRALREHGVPTGPGSASIGVQHPDGTEE